MADETVIIKIGAIVAGVVVLLTGILLGVSFSDVNYYEYGLLRRKSTGQVYDDTVYTTGRHLVGPDFEFKIFKADAHVVNLNSITVFASDKLEVTISATFQYFLREHDLPLLHRQYDKYYAPILRTNAQDALKGAATRFSTREFIRERNLVETALFKIIRDRLGGKCCQKGCTKTNTCRAGCTAIAKCTKAEKGLFADVKFFQLRTVKIPSDVEGRFLRALLLTEKTATEKLIQEFKVVQKRTEALINDIKNTAAEIAHNATAQSSLINTRAEATATSIVENARSHGLKLLFEKVGLSQEAHKNSFDYLRTLKDQKNAHLSVDFGQLMVAPGFK